MNIDWNDAPYWANWCAMDDNGEWWWHEYRPNMLDGEWVNQGRALRYDIASCNLIQRPVDD